MIFLKRKIIMNEVFLIEYYQRINNLLF